METSIDLDGLDVIRSRPAHKLFAALPPPAPIGRPQPGRPAGRKSAKVPTTAAARVRGGVHLNLPLPAPIPAGQVRAAGRRLVATLAHIEGPVVWRLAAHAAVLVLTLGVVVTPFLPGSRTASASARPGFLHRDWTDRAIAFVPDSIVGSEARSITAAEVRPGFISPGAIVEAKSSLLPWNKPEIYTVSGGDSLASIAERFGIEPIWLMYTNPVLRQTPFRLSPGMKLNILPSKAVVHVVKEGDSIDALARQYRSEAAKVLGYKANGLGGGGALTPGMELVIPDGEMDIKLPEPPKPKVVNRGQGWTVPAAAAGGATGSGQFYAGAYGSRTQGYGRWHRGADIANRTGTPIFAVDSGTVVYAGRHYWMGLGIVIDHGNGYESWYAHLSGINVAKGQAVQRGQVIGAMGCSYGPAGRCTLEIHLNGVPVNPCPLGACG